ncbi:hypothetical protein M406DRAFT_358489 [Cryphonectria parasitica EP155]|uniref:Uncharacterized protein n=1 Tax=Cryphonectria parasitica (strain ATCC 38755 / EP155) TaxID=660469 RepID=A0A9P4XUC3_CRYP1|nr:uncharacterized protein M406DRAFT_358489 [Cryphonectria parasitica EP155]KAF3761129.1 hypothetical protein M406DRAFT_358489 [Cryphonectria parasitica EP155]
MQFSMGNPGLNHPADPSNFLPSQQQVPASKPKIPSPQATNIGPPMEPSQCTKCLLYHPATIRCPSLTTEGRIRLALDEVKKLSGGLPVATQRNRERLQQLLKLRKNERLGESGRPSPRAPQPRLQQQPQPRLSAPNEEGGSLHQETHQDNTQ